MKGPGSSGVAGTRKSSGESDPSALAWVAPNSATSWRQLSSASTMEPSDGGSSWKEEEVEPEVELERERTKVALGRVRGEHERERG